MYSEKQIDMEKRVFRSMCQLRRWHHCYLPYTAVNPLVQLSVQQDGRSASLTAPNGPAQEEMVTRVRPSGDGNSSNYGSECVSTLYITG